MTDRPWSAGVGCSRPYDADPVTDKSEIALVSWRVSQLNAGTLLSVCSMTMQRLFPWFACVAVCEGLYFIGEWLRWA
jgi:hypothetical protein